MTSVEELLSLSDERDRYLQRILGAQKAAYHKGYTDGFEQGQLAVIAAIKQVEADTVQALKDHITTWGPGGRSAFADPRPGDYMGRSA